MQQITQQPRKHSTLSRTRSGETLAFTDTADSRPGETRYSGGFTNSRSGEAFSPERDYASLKTGMGRLGEFSWQ